MSARAPAAIEQLFTAIHSHIPAAEFGGIVGDTAHSFGYHLARRDLPGSDYSVTLTLDREGASDCASALDVTFGSGSPWMKTCTQRLLTAAKARDPRLRALREFCGTLDGSNTYPWDLSTDTSEGVNSWDDSHLWHIHLSFYRAFADNAAALAPIADVFCGVTPEPPATEDEEMMMIYVDPNGPDKVALKGAFLGVWLLRESAITKLLHDYDVNGLAAAGVKKVPVRLDTFRALGGK